MSATPRRRVGEQRLPWRCRPSPIDGVSGPWGTSVVYRFRRGRAVPEPSKASMGRPGFDRGDCVALTQQLAPKFIPPRTPRGCSSAKRSGVIASLATRKAPGFGAPQSSFSKCAPLRGRTAVLLPAGDRACRARGRNEPSTELAGGSVFRQAARSAFPWPGLVARRSGLVEPFKTLPESLPDGTEGVFLTHLPRDCQNSARSSARLVTSLV